MYPSVFEVPAADSEGSRFRQIVPGVVSLMEQMRAELEKGERPVHYEEPRVSGGNDQIDACSTS